MDTTFGYFGSNLAAWKRLCNEDKILKEAFGAFGQVVYIPFYLLDELFDCNVILHLSKSMRGDIENLTLVFGIIVKEDMKCLGL